MHEARAWREALVHLFGPSVSVVLPLVLILLIFLLGDPDWDPGS